MSSSVDVLADQTVRLALEYSASWHVPCAIDLSEFH